MKTDELTTGMRGTALSVTSGRNPVTFSAEVLGVLRDAVGPGRDIIIVNLSGNPVQAAGGLWFGASGSPVFFRDSATGKYELAGAIAYGLTFGSSTLAGLTPATDMASLLTGGGGGDPVADRVALPRGLALRMADAADLSVASVSSLVRLKTPLSASGLTDRGLGRVQAAIDRERLPFFAYKGSSGSTNPTPPTGKLRAGDSFAAALSLGDVTLAGVGTTTFVCEGRTVAFGHPFSWTGKTTLAARAADTITIVKDPIFGSYKLANIAENLGTVTQDRLAGIVGELGEGPGGAPVSSTVTDLDTGRTRSGSSTSILPEFTPFLAFIHLFQNIDVTIDRIGPGNAEVAYAIRGTRDEGRTWAVERASHYASPWDISFDSIGELSFTAEVLQAFEAEDIEITSIEVSQIDIEEAFEAYRLQRVLAWNGRRYVRTEFVRSRPGATVRLRAVLKALHTGSIRTVDLALGVPQSTRQSGLIEVFGGGSGGFEEDPCFFADEECDDGEGAEQTFDELLAFYQKQPRGDVLGARLRVGSGGTVRTEIQKQQDAVVFGRSFLGFVLAR